VRKAKNGGVPATNPAGIEAPKHREANSTTGCHGQFAEVDVVTSDNGKRMHPVISAAVTVAKIIPTVKAFAVT
jgi:hypothetical protein